MLPQKTLLSHIITMDKLKPRVSLIQIRHAIICIGLSDYLIFIKFMMGKIIRKKLMAT